MEASVLPHSTNFNGGGGWVVTSDPVSRLDPGGVEWWSVQGCTEGFCAPGLEAPFSCGGAVHKI